MRVITSHVVEGDSLNHQLNIEVLDDPGWGGANHSYAIGHRGEQITAFKFQKGPIAEAGVNGVSNEALLAIVIDRLEGFQRGDFQSNYNERALMNARWALEALQARTKDRLARGVEGSRQA